MKNGNAERTPPHRSGEFRRFDAAMHKIMAVSKQELQARIEADSHKTGKRKPLSPASAVSDPASDDKG
jgi:hypothetical protein